jgi:hypothetical protein
MSDTVIRVENLGKKYIIGHQQEGKAFYKSFREAIALIPNSEFGINKFSPLSRYKGYIPFPA